MRYLIISLLLFVSINSNAQLTIFRRATNTITTIPDTTQHVSGKISSTSPSTNLLYVGPVNLATMFNSTGPNGSSWIYLPANTAQPLAKVMSVTSTGTGTYTIGVDRPITGQTNDSLYKIVANVYSYSLVNDTTTTGKINGISFKPGVSIEMPYNVVNGRGTLQDPVYLNATGTSFFIIERH